MTKVSSAQGQILVLVLLVVLVGLTVGLSIASRTLTNIKNAGDLDQSNRAFSAAEAGIERALATIKAGGTCTGTICEPSITGVDGGAPDVTVVTAGGGSGAFGIPSLAKDDVIQLNLSGYTGTTFDLYWGTAGDESAQNTSSAAVVSVVYANGGATSYGLGKAAYDYYATGRTNNFTPATVGFAIPGGLTLQDGTNHNDYAFKATINLTNGAGRLVPVNNVPVLARVRLLYAGDKQIAFAPGASPCSGTTCLPTQGQQITSTASAGGKTRTVKVFKSNATLPAIFDYALFNGSTSALTK